MEIEMQAINNTYAMYSNIVLCVVRRLLCLIHWLLQSSHSSISINLINAFFYILFALANAFTNANGCRNFLFRECECKSLTSKLLTSIGIACHEASDFSHPITPSNKSNRVSLRQQRYVSVPSANRCQLYHSIEAVFHRN